MREVRSPSLRPSSCWGSCRDWLDWWTALWETKDYIRMITNWACWEGSDANEQLLQKLFAPIQTQKNSGPLLSRKLWVNRGRGHWPPKGVWGCAALKTPFLRLSCSSQGSHLKQKSFWATHFTRHPLGKINKNFSFYSLNFCPNFSSSPQIWKFQFKRPLFQRQRSVRKPHTLEIWAAHPYLKKVECPSPGQPHRKSFKVNFH